MTNVAIIGNGIFGSKIENCIKDTVQFVEPNVADWIIVATPNDLHYEHVEYWLSQKKNVFCEKPLTLTEKTSKELFLLADFMGVKLYVDDVFSWHDNLNINTDGVVDFKFHKYGSFNANIIDNLSYHHFYLWVNSDDIEVDKISYTPSSDYNTSLNFQVDLKDGRSGKFDYNILYSDGYIHKIDDGWDIVDVNPNNNPLRDMLLKCFEGSVNFEKNRKKTLNAVKLCEAVKREIYPKVLVVGGGIFGTTASVVLATSGFNVTLHEELDGIMKCASNINQYRLHKGYHYPRSKETVNECLAGIKQFKRKYGDSVVNGDINHFYAISSRDSLVSREQYLEFLDEMGLEYNLHEPLNGTDLTIEVDEELFDSDKLTTQASYKMKGVGVNVVLNKHTTKEDFDNYDYVVIATYSKINELLDDKKQYQYEVVEKPVVRLPDSYKNKSVVVMDGPFMCLDPYKSDLHVLGHVKHAIHSTNVGDYPMVLNKDIVGYLNNGVISNPKITKIQKFIEAGKEFFEDFDKLEHVGSMFTVRTVLSHRDYDDARPTLVVKESDKVFTIFSGKIGTCVKAANQLVQKIKGLKYE
jgi:D-amino-acid oxidase